jgi:hypothetical protein
MTDLESFADRIRTTYPEGLTGVFAVGGTRTSYILEKQRNDTNPGVIEDFETYADHGFDRLFELIEMFLELGGQNMVIALFSYQGFYERGGEYAEQAARMCLRVIDEAKIKFYKDHEIDPYFAGIDTLLHLPENQYAHQLGSEFAQFQQHWQFQEGRRKIIWEVAPIPLFSFWRANLVMGNEAQAELEASLQQCTDLREMHDSLYRYYARAVYGTDLPIPNFYLGANRNGDLKLRSLLPIALLCGGPFRLYYTPYPSLFITSEALQAILEDLAFGKPLNSMKFDYRGRITSELLQAEYQRVQELSANPESTLGLIRQVGASDAD